MASDFFIVASPGGVKLARRLVVGEQMKGREFQGGGTNVGLGGLGRLGRPITAFTAKARGEMRWVWNALPWDEVPRLSMLTLTYPGNWRSVVPDGATLRRHLRAFRERWVRKWGQPMGTWVLEFQPRESQPVLRQFAPHFHLYVGLPVGAELARDPFDDRLVWDWARRSWYEIAGSGDERHRYWGVHVRPCFYGRFGGGQENGKKVGDYLWRESGKLAQKQAPEGFEGLKWWAVWGLQKREHELAISRDEFVAIRRPMRTLRDERAHRKVKGPRGLDGLQVTNVDGVSVAVRLQQWAESEVGVASSSAAERAAQRATPPRTQP